MEFAVKSGSPEKQRTSCVVVGVFDSRKLSESGEMLDRISNGFISSIIRRGDMEGKLGQTLLLHSVPGTLSDRVLLVGCGKERDFDLKAFRSVNATMTQFLNETGSTEAASYLTELSVRGLEIADNVRQSVEAIEDCLYRFDQFKSQKESLRRPLRRIILSVPSRRDLPPGEEAMRQGVAIASGVKLAKDLGNMPGNICTPAYLAEQAKALAKTYRSVEIEILEQEDMEKLGMGSLLAVAKGSAVPPKLITLQYRGADKNAKPVVLVGKGVTFDSGGISIKPGANMDEMKYDMSGAASVMATISVAAELHLPINVTAVIPAVENMPDGQAIKPGDIVTSMSGQTIEILNTDAEGRLILCDALTYCGKYDPEVVIDVATLTGACIIALGREPSGLMGNHNPLINDILGAGRRSGDRAWELPLWDEYQSQLDSNFADMANVGNRDGGTITAAAFLSRFCKKYRWAHLDVAGTAWKTGSSKGSTGRPVPLLSQYLIDRVREMSEK